MLIKVHPQSNAVSTFDGPVHLVLSLKADGETSLMAIVNGKVETMSTRFGRDQTYEDMCADLQRSLDEALAGTPAVRAALGRKR